MSNVKVHRETWKDRKVAAGLCPYCGKPARKGRLQCLTCSNRKALRDRRRRAASVRGPYRCGLCRSKNHTRQRCDARRVE